jgi:tetratricopeptide (TPR) repeat protein
MTPVFRSSRRRIVMLLAAALIAGAAARPVSAQELSELSLPAGGNGASQRARVSQWIGPVEVTIDYHSPAVHFRGADRTGHIWGELVGYGMFDEGFGPSTATPWRAGANESTTIAFSDAVRIGGKELSAGRYALFLELGEKGPWTWIFSNHPGWGSYQYDPKNDVLRVSAEPREAPFSEYLTYSFDDRLGDSATAYLQWEKKRVPFKIEVPNSDELYVERMRRELEEWPGFNYQNWQTAAQFCADRKIDLEEALVWADRAIREPFRGATIGVENFSTLQTKAAVLEAMGRESEAEEVMEKALRFPGTSSFEIYQYGSRRLAAKKNQAALDVFKLNRARHPEEKFWTFLGLARGYTALGDRKNAIANWETALANVPAAQKGSVPRMRNMLESLKKGA